jgi:pilus assembly protein Flp/PilA
MESINNWMRDEDGQGMVEYALIIGLISVVAIAILGSLGGKVKNKFKQINDNLT